MKLLGQFKYTLHYIPSEYCGKQQYEFCIWPLRRLRMNETLIGAEITTVRYDVWQNRRCES